MAPSRDYRKVAADCARLALVAPSLEARAGFAAAAKSWLMLAQMAGEHSTRADDASTLQGRRASAIAEHEPRNTGLMD
jgi:hypothetical protein